MVGMAARLNRNHSEQVIQRIRTSQLVNRLQDHVFGTLKGPPSQSHPDGAPLALTDSQVRSACFLIERTLAKAESPKTVNLNGTLTLTQLIEKAAQPSASEIPNAQD